MKRIHYSSKFKKDFKKYKMFPSKVEALEKVLSTLLSGYPLPTEYKPHVLKGNYKGCLEFHIDDDFLLIWIDDEIIELLRLGTHSELFAKKRR